MKPSPHTWFETITHPRSHLLATLSVFGIIIIATVTSVNFPQWGVLLFVVALVPGTIWYIAMMRAHARNRRAPNGERSQ